MKNFITILLFFFSSGDGLFLHAQTIERFNCFSYNVNEGLLQTTINDMAFDKNNFCWLSFPNGIQKFDGKNFTMVPVQPGLPDDKHTFLFRCSNGELLISHSQGISKYDVSANRFIQVYKYNSVALAPAQFIGEDESVVYFYSQTGNITGINSQSLKRVSEIKTGFPDYSSVSDYRPKFSDNIINHKVALLVNSSLYLWDLQKGKQLSRSSPVADISRGLLKLKTENEVLYYDFKIPNALQLYNFTTHTKTPLFIKGKDDKLIYQCTIFTWQNKILFSFSNRIYETDSTFGVLKKELVNFQNQPLTANQGIACIKEDNFGNLYLQTVKGGIKKIIRNTYRFKYYSTGKPDSSFIISILPDKRSNRILAGTSDNGLLVFDTLQHLVKHIKILPGGNQPFNVNTILKTKRETYLLFIGNNTKVWELSHDFLQLKSIPVSTNLPENKKGTGYFGNFLFQNDREALVQSQSNLYRVDFAANSITEHLATTGYTMSGILYNNTIITHTNDELIFLDRATFNVNKRIPFKNTGNVRCFAIPVPAAGGNTTGNIYIGSNKGIFKIDSNGNILQHLNKEKGLPDECIYAMAFDENGSLWCSTNKGLLKINKDNSLQQFRKEDGLQENEFNTNSVATADDGELFFGGVNGLSSFYPSAISSFEDKPNILITGLKVNNEDYFKDTAVWMLKKIILPYNKKSFSFDFVAMGAGNPEQYIYQYKMNSLDKEWIQNSGTQTVRYFLQPGKYTFQVYASRQFDSNAKPLKEITIIIEPPFWRTWWFLTGLAGIFIAAMTYAINRYNKNKYQKKLAALETEHKVQLERERISRDLHDSIGAYANAVLYNTELLEKEDEERLRQELMKDVKFASKDIITALRETIWALKKDNYDADDCFMRIRNFILSFMRYYHHIDFKIGGETPANKKLHYTKALNIVRTVQEAVTNAIKHASAGSVTITSYDREGKWELVVTDDGKGFDHGVMRDSEQGNGLNNMKKRAADSGFDLIIRSDPDKGTSIKIIV